MGNINRYVFRPYWLACRMIIDFYILLLLVLLLLENVFWSRQSFTVNQWILFTYAPQPKPKWMNEWIIWCVAHCDAIIYDATIVPKTHNNDDSFGRFFFRLLLSNSFLPNENWFMKTQSIKLNTISSVRVKYEDLQQFNNSQYWTADCWYTYSLSLSDSDSATRINVV